jgi:dolichol-phosphate mannosyltransferase
MEMNYRAHKKGFRIKEIPIEFACRTAGESKMTVGEFWESLKMPWRLRLKVR